MNIAVVVESFPVISETFITNKVLHLCKRGHHVTVITHRKNKSDNLKKLYNLEALHNLTIVPPAIPVQLFDWFKLIISKPVIFLQSLSSPKSFKVTSRNKLLAKSFENHSFDIIHFEFSGLGIFYKDIISSLKPKTVVSCRGTAEKVKPLSVPERKTQMKELFKAVDSIHCVSEDMAQTITTYCDQVSKIFVNRPSIDISHFKRIKEQKDYGKIIVLSIGRFTFQKGYLTGLLAVKKLVESNIDFEWLIVGDGPQLEENIFHIHTLGLQNHVKLLGKKNKTEVLELYSKADVFLLSSVYEGIANVVLEAMAMELPVVSTRSGGLEEVIEPNVDGLLANVYDHETLGKHLIELCTNPDLRKRLGQQARIKIENQFTIERQIDEFENVYSSLLNKNKS